MLKKGYNRSLKCTFFKNEASWLLTVSEKEEEEVSEK